MTTGIKIALGVGAAAALYYWWTHRTPCGCHGSDAMGVAAVLGSSMTANAQSTTNFDNGAIVAGIGAPTLGSTPGQTSQVGNGGAPVGTLGFFTSVQRAVAATNAPKPAPPAPYSQITEPTILGGVGVQGMSPTGQPYIVGVS